MARKKTGSKREQECKKISKQRAKRMWWQAARVRLGWVVVIVFTFYALTTLAWFTFDGGFQRTADRTMAWVENLSAKAGFRLSYVYLEGRHKTSQDAIDKAVALKQGQPILFISLAELKQRLEAIPHIHTAQVERVLPNQIRIQIEERQPIAVWQYQGKLKLIDREGKVMPDPMATKFHALPLVVGEDAPTHAWKLLQFVTQEPELMNQMKSAIRVGERRWNIRFENGVELKLPESKPEIAWRKFALLNKEQELLKRNITAVDMRLQDRIFIKRPKMEKQPVADDANASDT